MRFEELLEEKNICGEYNYSQILDNVAKLIIEEDIPMRNTFNDCVKMYAKAHNKPYNHETMIECLSLIMEIGLTRHIINNINQFDLLGYGKYKEE